MLIRVPWAGQTTLSGQWDSACADATLTVTDLQGHIVGTGLVQVDGSFAIQLLRPVETNEILHLTQVGGDCRYCILSQGFVVIGPIPVPESATLLLFASGLAGLAGVVRARRLARRCRCRAELA
jgi:hypothetical protein